MSKEYLGKTTVASLIRLIKAELSKYVKTTAMDARIPAPTSDDNGKFLRVTDGVAVWDTIPNAEEARF